MTALPATSVNISEFAGIEVHYSDPGLSPLLRPTRADYPHLFQLDTKLGFYRTMLVEGSLLSNAQIAKQAEHNFGSASEYSVNWCASELRELGFDIKHNDERGL